MVQELNCFLSRDAWVVGFCNNSLGSFNPLSGEHDDRDCLVAKHGPLLNSLFDCRATMLTVIDKNCRGHGNLELADGTKWSLACGRLELHLAVNRCAKGGENVFGWVLSNIFRD